MPHAICPPPEELLAFMLGKLPDGAAETMAGHLDDCTACESTATSLEQMSDSFVAELRRPTGDGSFLDEQDFQAAAAVIASLGHDPTDVGVDRRRAVAESRLAQLGQYQLLEVLGQGGMGTVYKALHLRLEKVVAVKVLPPARMTDEGALARFDREMKAVGRLDHPNIVRAMDAGEADRAHYLVMEYVPGEDLARLVRRRGRLPIAESCELIRQAAVGLQHAHEHGMVHRDIKPSNLLLTSPASGERKLPETARTTTSPPSHTAAPHQGANAPRSPMVDAPRSPMVDAPRSPTVKILDLGLALLADVHQPAARDLTGTGQMMGTLDYMAPEQGGDSHEVDIRADVYSLGATLYKLLTGQAIFHGPQYQTQLQKMMALANEPAPPIQRLRPELPNELAAVVHRMIAKNPRQRYSTPAKVAAAIEPFARQANLARLLDDHSGAEGEYSSAAPERPTGSAAGGPNRWQAAGVAAIAMGLIGVILAALLVFRTPHGTVTVEIDDAHRQDVSLVVTGGGGSLTLDEKSGWTLKLADGRYDIALADSKDQFQIDQDTVTVRRGDHVTVRVTRRPNIDRPAAGESLGEQAVAWLVKNNAFGPDHKFIDDARAQILPQTADGHGFSYRISGDLLTSGKPTVLTVHGNKLFTHELTSAQAKLMGLTEQPIAGFRVGPSKIGKRAEKPEFRLTSLRLDHEDALGVDGQIAGWIEFERLRPADEPDTHYSLRVVLMFDRATTLAQGIAGDLSAERGKVRLHVDNTLPKNWNTAAMTMFIELGTLHGSEDLDDFVALSDPLSTVITLNPIQNNAQREATREN